MQSLQCLLQHHMANPLVSTHMATEDDNNHAAIQLRSAATDSKPPYNYAHTHTRIQSSLKPPLHCGKEKTAERSQPAPAAHTSCPSLRLQRIYKEKRDDSHSGFLPTTSPLEHLCSHYSAFCSITWQTHLYLRTWQQKMTTVMQPSHCDLQPQIPNRPTTTHTQTHPKQLEATVTLRQRLKTAEPSQPAAAAHTSCPSLPAAAPLHGKTQCFAPRLPPHSKPHATFMQPLHCFLQHHIALPKPPLPLVTTSKVITSHGNHFPWSPLPSVTTSLTHHFPQSPLSFVITSLSHHFPWSPLP